MLYELTSQYFGGDMPEKTEYNKQPSRLARRSSNVLDSSG